MITCSYSVNWRWAPGQFEIIPSSLHYHRYVKLCWIQPIAYAIEGHSSCNCFGLIVKFRLFLFHFFLKCCTGIGAGRIFIISPASNKRYNYLALSNSISNSGWFVIGHFGHKHIMKAFVDKKMATDNLSRHYMNYSMLYVYSFKDLFKACFLHEFPHCAR